MNEKTIEQLNYLNIDEITKLCETYDIEYKYYYQNKDDEIKQTKTLLRKSDIIKNIKRRLNDERINKKIIKKNQVYDKNIKNKYVLYGDYKFLDAKLKIQPLIKNVYEGAISFMMLYSIWTKNKNYTYEQFAKYYDLHYDTYKNKKHPEWAYNSETQDIKNWKKYRNNIARKVILIVNDFLNK